MAVANNPKRIAIDGRFFGEAGPGRYTKAIIEHLEKLDTKNTYFIFLKPRGMNEYVPKNANFIKIEANHHWYGWDEQIRFLFKIILKRPHLLYVPHFNFPVLYPGKIITAIPDIIMHTFSTSRGTTLFKPYFWLKKFVYRLVIYWAVLRSTKVIVPALETKKDFIKLMPFVSDSKFVLAPEGVDPDFIDKSVLSDAGFIEATLQKYGISQPFLLYVSSMYEHKNVPRLLEAFKLLREKFGFIGQLVLVGKKDKISMTIPNVARALGVGDHVLFPGLQSYVTDKEVVALRARALAYIFPSLKEGFSLTPIEAQALGLPCAISNIGCHTEIYGDSVLYFDPLNVNDMAEKMNMISTDERLRQNLISKGFEWYKKYDWNETARITFQEFCKALKI